MNYMIVFALLLQRRYVTLKILNDECGMRKRQGRKVLDAIGERYELTKEEGAVPARGLGQTAYYFKPAYKRKLTGRE